MPPPVVFPDGQIDLLNRPLELVGKLADGSQVAFVIPYGKPLLLLTDHCSPTTEVDDAVPIRLRQCKDRRSHRDGDTSKRG